MADHEFSYPRVVEISPKRHSVSVDDFGILPRTIKPEVSRGVEPGFLAWAALVTGVAVYDYQAIKRDRQTMTQAFHLGMEHPIWKYMCIGALGATALHLTRAVPQNLDVYYWFGHNHKADD